MGELCLCGHPDDRHFGVDDPSGKTICLDCYGMGIVPAEIRHSYHKFKLDNLVYIERKAKRKKLI